MCFSSRCFCRLLVVTVAFFMCSVSQAQLYSIDWYSIDAGGGYASGSVFELEGTIGQPDAGQMLTGGGFELQGGFRARTNEQTQTVLVPMSVVVTRGEQVNGGVNELADSDNADLFLRRANSDIRSRTEFQVKTFSTTGDPVSLSVTLETSVFARSETIQTIELYNFQIDVWERVDSRPARRLVDSTVIVTPSGDLSRFVEAMDLVMQARIRFDSANPRQMFSSNTDRFIWTVE